MADVVLNSAVRSNLRTLQSTTDLLNRTEQRLATGKKVNSALDNPSNFFTSQGLNRRASDLNNLLDSVGSTIQTLKAADNGIKAITDIVESLKATARSALQSTVAVATKANVESAAITGLTEDNLLGGTPTSGTLTFANNFAPVTITDAADTISFNIAVDGGVAKSVTISQASLALVGDGDTTLDSPAELQQVLANAGVTDVTVALASPGGPLQFTSNSTGAGSSVAISGYSEVDANTNTTDTPLVPTGAAAVAGQPAIGPLNGQNLTVQDRNGVTKTVVFSTGGISTLKQLNEWFEDNNVDLQAKVSVSNGSGKLKLETTNAAANVTPGDIGGSITGVGNAFAGDQTFSTPVLDVDAAEKRSNYADDYNESMKEIAKLAKDSNYNGVNLLMGDDLEVVFNEDGSSKLNIKGVQFDPTGIGLSEISAADFYDSSSINKVLDQIEAAFKTIEAQSAKFGSQLQIVETRETFTKDMVGTLEDGAHSLTGADTNEEAANLATLQTRQQLIVQSLSISTQQEQSILELLR